MKNKIQKQINLGKLHRWYFWIFYIVPLNMDWRIVMKLKNGLWMVLLAFVVSACATDTTSTQMKATAKPSTSASARPSKTEINITQTKEMAYQCIIKGKQQTLRVMYGLSKQDVVVAQMSLDGELSPILMIDKNQGPGTVFRNRGLWWISGSHDSGSGYAQSNTLVLKTLENTATGQAVRDHVIAQSCHFDPNETARIMERTHQMETRQSGGLVVPQEVMVSP